MPNNSIRLFTSTQHNSSDNSNGEDDVDCSTLDISEILFNLILEGDIQSFKSFLCKEMQDISLLEETEKTSDFRLLQVAAVNPIIPNENKKEIIEILLDHGIPIDKTDSTGMTALHYVAINNQVEMAVFLIEHGANLNKQNNAGDTPLHLAILAKNEEMISLLLRSNSSRNLKNKLGKTFLHIAAIDMVDYTVITKHLAPHVEIDAEDIDHWTPMHVAVMHGNNGMIDFLIKNGSRIDPIQFRLYRQFAIIFNYTDLYNFLKGQHRPNLQNGGMPQESILIIREMISSFVAKHLDYQRHFSSLIEALKKYVPVEDYSDALTQPNENMTIMSVASYKHVSYILVERKLDNHEQSYVINLCDRGVFGITDFQKEALYPITKFTTTKENYLEVMNNLISICHTGGYEEFYDFVDRNCEKLDNSGVYPLRQKRFKNGNCYFENLKSLILYALIKQTDKTEGKEIYKKFDIFMHETILEKYINFSQDACKEVAVDLCNTFIRTKKSKLLLFSPNPTTHNAADQLSMIKVGNDTDYEMNETKRLKIN